jgi:tetratricopeptide (TPR) repeat protein
MNNELNIKKSIYMKTADFLIKHNAFTVRFREFLQKKVFFLNQTKLILTLNFKWAEKCMAKELVSPTGGPGCQYHVLLAKIKLAKNQLDEAEKHCSEALLFDYQNFEAWIIWSHVRYLMGDFVGAKQRYERVLQFHELPSDQTHAIYIRLASIYLKEENVSAFLS